MSVERNGPGLLLEAIDITGMNDSPEYLFVPRRSARTIWITPSTTSDPINEPLTPENIQSADRCGDPNCERCNR